MSFSLLLVGDEYFWDTDPDVGNGSPIPVYLTGDKSTIGGEFATDGLSTGTQHLYVRPESAKGSWPHPSLIEMTISKLRV
ncbi:MAG: hypothetical protein SH856_08570 [Flavobacteriales bacterium]|nr:hypothetical protein [Flavobacteriales bacterium]